ncbi:MAG: DUF4105 domain-containing protein [Desulfatibacillaceae bacterium]|nr:DUF4105 domain-containing protein [Desulfatibacillaceae bacterium]
MDDPSFFLTGQGKLDPKAELLAFIRALFSTEDSAVTCRFVARRKWIMERLGISQNTVASPQCPDFEDWMNSMDAHSAHLVFASAHIQSPASMFGHTLIVIQTQSGNRLLWRAVNYSAVTSANENPLVYALRGLTGRYQGYFSLGPYYEKLAEYAFVSQRDLWEYPLDLDQEQIRRMLSHVYELSQIYSNYYFLDENCSYTLLYLLDAARPELALTSKKGSLVFPVNTVRMALDAGLAGQPVYTPSKAAIIQNMANSMPADDVKKAKEVGRGRISPKSVLESEISSQRQIQVLNLVAEWLGFLHTSGRIQKDTFVTRYRAALEARSLAGKDFLPLPEPKAPPRPDKGHGPGLVAAGWGLASGDAFMELRLRPAYHDLCDPQTGFADGSAISFLDTRLRFFADKQKFELESLEILSISSSSPRNRLIKPISWEFKAGWQQRIVHTKEKSLVFDIVAGRGLAWELPLVGLFFVMARGEAAFSGALEDNYSLAAGLKTGLVRQIGPIYFHAQGQGAYSPLGETGARFETGLCATVPISRNAAFAFSYLHQAAHGISQNSAQGQIKVYF